jgi:hypothetical protein
VGLSARVARWSGVRGRRAWTVASGLVVIGSVTKLTGSAPSHFKGSVTVRKEEIVKGVERVV